MTTVDPTGRVNLAPFRFPNVFGASPPVVVFSPTTRRDGSKKDTLRNVEATGEFVVNAAVEGPAAEVNLSSKEVGFEESEVVLTGLTTRPSDLVRPPRPAEPPAALESRLVQVLPIGSGGLAATLLVGEVVANHVDDSVLGPDGRVDPARLRPIGRLGGDDSCRSTEIFRLERPR